MIETLAILLKVPENIFVDCIFGTLLKENSHFSNNKWDLMLEIFFLISLSIHIL